MKMQPYMVKDMKSSVRKKGEDKGEGSSSFAGGAVSSCKKCKSKVAKPGAQYCQSVCDLESHRRGSSQAVCIQGWDMLSVWCGSIEEQVGECLSIPVG